MKLKIDRMTGIIFNEETMSAVGFIGPREPERISWAPLQEIMDARIALAAGHRPTLTRAGRNS